MDGERLLLDRIERIDRISRFVARRHRLDPAEAEEFQSALSTFLSTVIHRLFLDYCVSLWGKWRPSAEARRVGPVAVRLETLMGRDGLSFDEACEVLTVTEGLAVGRTALHSFRMALPMRAPRRFVGEDALVDRADPGVDLEGQAIED